MSPAALLLVLGSAVCHASWNLLAKGARDTAAYTWLFTAVSVVVYFPFVLLFIWWTQPELGRLALLFIVVSGCLHLAYFLMIGEGYRAGDLSLVYPVAWGASALLSIAGGMLVLGERPSAVAGAGGLAIVAGMLVMTLPRGRTWAAGHATAIAYALGAGLVIAIYTLWDKRGVAVLAPIVYKPGADLTRTLLLAPVALGTRARRRVLVDEWRARPRAVVATAVLSPLSYLLVLTALSFTPVSYVAPARQVSIVLGAALGARVLREADPTRRLAGAAAIAAGVVALTLG